MLINEFVAMRLHKQKQNEIRPEAHGNRVLDEIITEIKMERERRSRNKQQRNS